ncbi:hypothetical protein HID58_047125, partial [Brassica napus]
LKTLTQSLWVSLLQVYEIVNRSQTLAFGTLQGECMLSQTLILPHKSKVKIANEIFSIGISR